MAWTRRAGSKYGAIPTEYDGVRYASRAEARYAEMLDSLIKAGEVRWWIGQPLFRLGVADNKFRPDFLVVPVVGLPYAVDVKGARTKDFNRNARLWAVHGPCDLWIVSGKELEIIHPGGEAS